MPELLSEKVRVELGARSYDIVIGDGILADLAPYLESLKLTGRVAIVCDEIVHDLHGEAISRALSDYETHIIVRPGGEAEKSFGGLQAVLDSLFRAGFGRHDTVVAFGGGVIGDLSGFAASIYKRGMNFVQIPTTLLAQVDSSVGGKTAINNEFGKNLIGSFYQPRLVLIDTQLLRTLPERQVKAGYAEIVKYGLIDQPDFFKRLDDGEGERVLALDPDALRMAIAQSCTAKAEVVSRDEREGGARALLNLGHTFAHALELEAGYKGDLLHGEAVSAGMDMAFEISSRLGLCEPSEAERVKHHLKRLNMPIREDMAELLADRDAILRHMGQDKKNEGDRLTLILTHGIGRAFVEKNASQEAVRDYLEEIAP